MLCSLVMYSCAKGGLVATYSLLYVFASHHDELVEKAYYTALHTRVGE